MFLTVFHEDGHVLDRVIFVPDRPFGGVTGVGDMCAPTVTKPLYAVAFTQVTCKWDMITLNGIIGLLIPE